MPESSVATEPVPEVSRRRARRFTAGSVLNVFGPFLILAFVTGFFAAIMPAEVRENFFSFYNFKSILNQTVIVAIGALGMTMIIVSGGIDLSVGSSVALTSVLGATLLLKGYPPTTAVLLTMLAGAAIGLVNGSIISGLRMMPFIVTLGMMGVARGAAKWIAGNVTVNAPDSAVNELMRRISPNSLLPLPPGVWITVALA